jgi:hypothetical protein
MAGEHLKSKKAQLALAVAQGISAAKWARNNEVCKMTAYRWAKEPKVRAAVEAYRRRAIDQAIGRMAMHTTTAADGIAKIAKESESDAVRLRAYRALFSDMIATSKYTGLESRMADIEGRLIARDSDAGTNAWGRSPAKAGQAAVGPAMLPKTSTDTGTGIGDAPAANS